MRSQTDPLFAQWHTYEKLVAHNHMHHTEFFSALTARASTSLTQPIRILDLGCGDCAPVAGLLAALNVSFYKGIDESSAALALAKARLADSEITHSFAEFDMLDSLHRESAHYDLILSSYALHHLTTDRKTELLHKAARQLKPDGILAIIDIFKREGESRDDYLAAWIDNARRNYTSLSTAELDELCEHVTQRDFPESPSQFTALAAAAGLNNFEWTMSPDSNFAGLVTLYR